MIAFNLPSGLESIMAEMARETGQTPEQIRAIRERAVQTGDWSEWNRIKGTVAAGLGGR